jgi:ABC-type sugar transport system ATPase subunit
VLVVTSDYEEVVQVADRALVMSRGAVSARLDGASVTVEQLASAAGE